MVSTVGIVAAVLLAVSWVRPIGLTGLRALHILQLEEYQTVRYWRWLLGNMSATIDRWLVAIGLVGFVGAWLLPFPVWLAVAVSGSGVGIWATIRRKIPEAKKPLVLTARARRLLAGWIACVVGCVAVVIGGTSLAAGQASIPRVAALAGALVVLGVIAWPLASVANLLLYPVEAGFRAYYRSSAAKILKTYHPTVIGVAGSYGKTSTKTILAQILTTRFKTLATPRSFNTPMGLCRVIREQLRPEHRFFITELGAYQRGEIRELCRLVHPTIGVLTAVGPEHLERFGSLENVVLAESELVEALPAGGKAIFKGDDAICRRVSAAARCPFVFVGGPPGQNRLLWAEQIALSSDGLGFRLCHRDGRHAAVATRLLGRHNVGNVLLASAAALACGVTFEDLAPAIARLEPVEHRLQLIPNDNGIAVIDDTYNSNPRGAEAALEVLASFPGGRRYLVTPGMVELADLQDSAHREFGRQAARVCDGVILVGPRRTRAIAEGLTEAGFDSKRLIVARNLSAATERLRELLRGGDAVLFENDLPDNYAE